MDIVAAEKYIVQNQPEVIKLLVNFAQTDTILFWSCDETLYKKQKLFWQPLLDWLADKYSVNFISTTSITLPKKNKDQALLLKKHFETLYLKELTSLYLVGTSLKSILLGFAFIKKRITSEEAFKLSFLEEMHQNVFWGEDKEVVKNREKIYQDLKQIEEYLQE